VQACDAIACEGFARLEAYIRVCECDAIVCEGSAIAICARDAIVEYSTICARDLRSRLEAYMMHGPPCEERARMGRRGLAWVGGGRMGRVRT
jgi:hypothetical protein